MADTQLNISYHSITDKGGRAVNEDSLGILPTKDALYFLLCDGLGGHGGDIASSFVVEQMKANLEKGFLSRKALRGHSRRCLKSRKKKMRRTK